MHENNVAHRFVVFAAHIPAPNMTISDCTAGNIMFDPSNMYPESFHPAEMNRSKDFRRKAKWYSRTRRPTKYLLIDFGLSRQYDPANGPPLDKPYRGGDKSAPEHEDTEIFCNPFPTDVYYLGNLVREEFIQVCVLSLL
jgi:serine/threonine protein kinase